jgi:hypothetical protein
MMEQRGTTADTEISGRSEFTPLFQEIVVDGHGGKGDEAW